MPKRRPAKPGKTAGYSAAELHAGSRSRARASTGTPAAVVQAFAPDKVIAGNTSLAPVTGLHIILLQKIGSGVLKTEDAGEFSMEDTFAALYLFCTPVEISRELIAKAIPDDEAGVRRPAFEEAVLDFAATIEARHIPALSNLLNEHLKAAFAAAVPHGQKSQSRDPDSPFAAAPVPDPGTGG